MSRASLPKTILIRTRACSKGLPVRLAMRCVRRCCIVACNISMISPLHRSQRPFRPAIAARPFGPKQHGSWLDPRHSPQSWSCPHSPRMLTGAAGLSAALPLLGAGSSSSDETTMTDSVFSAMIQLVYASELSCTAVIATGSQSRSQE